MADEASTADAGSLTGENLESTVEINIKTLDSKIYTFRVGKDMPVPVLKEKLVDVTGIPVQRQRLIYRGKVLKDDHLLSEYHLEDGHTLHLVARQPVEGQASSGAGSEGAAQDNNQGSDSTPGAPRNRIGQISHSVLLGTLNVADPGENMVVDISRLVGAVLSSFGVSTGDPTGSVSGTPSVAATSSGAEAERNQDSSGSPASNSTSLTSTGLNIPLPPLHQVPQFPPARFLSPHMSIPDSLSTLSEFISRMEVVLQNGGSQPSPNNLRVPSTETPSLGANGALTPEMLRRVMEQTQELLRGNAAAALSRVATRLEREGTSTDAAVRGQVQAEALQIGAAMQHLGAMLLELGRTIMTLRMGQSPADSVVNAGPAVYISSSGPNPIMVQPFPMQTNSLFGTPSASMVNGPSGDSSRHVNIHIHTGSSFIPGVSNAAARGATGEAQQANREGNGTGDSVPTPGFPPRTVVAAIPTRPPTQTSGHVVSVIYPVQVRSQLSVPFPSASAEAPNPTMSSSGQRPTVVAQPSSETGTLPSIVEQISAQVVNALGGGSQRSGTAVNSGTQPPVVAPQPSSELRSLPPFIQQISAQVANALAGGALRFGSSSQSVQTTEAQGFLAQSNMARQMDQTPSIPSNAPGHSPSPDTQLTDSSCLREGPQQASPADSAQDDVKDHTGSADSAEQESTSSTARGVSMPIDEVHDISQESSSKSNSLHPNGGSGIDANSSATTSAEHTARLGQGSDSNRVTPLGLGLGGLQPKRRGKTAKTVGNDNVERETLPINQDPHSIARGQQLLQSLASQSSDGERANTNSTSSQQTSLVGQNMNTLPSQDQATNDHTQVDPADMMSLVLRTPAFSNILSGIAEQTGIGSSDDLRSMLEQCTQNPAIRNTLNNITQQVQREPESLGAIFSEIGNGQGGGLDFSRMIQHMMPAVSQALRGSTGSAPAPSLQPNSQPQSDNGGRVTDDTVHERDSTADIRRAVESIEQHDSPRNVFGSVLESAANLLGEQNSFGDLVSTLVNNEELTDDFMRMLCRDLHRRTQSDSTSEQ
ncbi:large proline-rich protein BAG6 isoform X1 [Asparagus officinalis]|uniref:large proline-rich protein BAG6 isoform X1 n=1 Tax=Asparagus officinalis TaxID=4686 RepID=UPI00098E256F|nr:large proline-rich protein BAG6 isoform X1 [Asparagus officinalis]